MKKRTALVSLIVVVALLVAGAVWAKKYYDARYVGHDYYTVVPLDEPVAVNDLYDREGKVVGSGYSYDLVGYDAAGQRRTLSFEEHADTLEGLYAPGTYLRVNASSQIVLGVAVVDKAQIPPEILDKL